MRSWDLFRESLSNILANPLRSTLSVLGVVFGVGSIVAMVGIGYGAEKEVERLIAALGARTLQVVPIEPETGRLRSVLNRTYGLSSRDLVAISESLPDSHVSRVGRRNVEKLSRQHSFGKLRLFAVDVGFLEIMARPLLVGRWFSSMEQSLGQPIMVLDQSLASDLFESPEAALGEWLLVDGVWLKCIGVLANNQSSPRGSATISKTSSTTGPGTSSVAEPTPTDGSGSGQTEAMVSGVSLEGGIVVPYETAELRMGPMPIMDQIHMFLIKVSQNLSPLLAKKMLESTLGILHQNAKVFSVLAAEEVIEQKRQASRLFTWFLLAIAAISLVVGAIGIANVMLAAVIERIREIGLRRALGARKKDIVQQFLMESISICLVGGLLGNGLGIGVALATGQLTGWSVVLPWWSFVVSILLAVVVGLAAGMYPAYAASRTSPIEALQGRAQ